MSFSSGGCKQKEVKTAILSNNKIQNLIIFLRSRAFKDPRLTIGLMRCTYASMFVPNKGFLGVWLYYTVWVILLILRVYNLYILLINNAIYLRENWVGIMTILRGRRPRNQSSIPGRAKRFISSPQRPDRPWSPLSLILPQGLSGEWNCPLNFI